jgi:DNA-binding protein H-NS
LELSSLDKEQLRTLLAQVQVQIVIAERDAIVRIRKQIEEIAREVGVSLPPVSPRQMDMPGPKSGREASMRYRHPTIPQWQWSGRGRPPIWVMDWESLLGTKEGLLISTNGVEKDAL